MSAPANPGAPSQGRRIRRVGNWDILPAVLGGALANAVADPRRLRRQLAKRMWIELKRFAASRVTNIDVAILAGIDRVRVEGTVIGRAPPVLGGLAALLGPRPFFDFARYSGPPTALLPPNAP